MQEENHSGRLSPANVSTLHRIHRWFCTHRPFSRMSLRVFPSITIEVRGIKFLVEPGRKNYTEGFVWRRGDIPERASIEALLKFTQKNSFIVDIGANIGLFSLALGKNATPNSKIICFEPNPDIANSLRKNISINNFKASFEVIEAAVGGTKKGEAQLNVPKKMQERPQLR